MVVTCCMGNANFPKRNVMKIIQVLLLTFVCQTASGQLLNSDFYVMDASHSKLNFSIGCVWRIDWEIPLADLDAIFSECTNR